MLAYAVLLVAAMTSSGASQRGRAADVFVYDPGQIAGGHPIQEKKPPAGSKAGAGIEGMGASKPTQASYVNISGNFGGVFTVSGIGSGMSQTQSNLISIATNRPLTFTATSFRPLSLGGTAQSALGTVLYSMSIYQGTPNQMGALVAGPAVGTDASFNGQTLVLSSGQVPTTESFVLVITRTLTLSDSATGAGTLVGTGYLSVTIN